jgi:hypothetical protein
MPSPCRRSGFLACSLFTPVRGRGTTAGGDRLDRQEQSSDDLLAVAEQAEPYPSQFLVSAPQFDRVLRGSARLRFALFLDVGTPPRTVGTSEADWLETSRLQSASPNPTGTLSVRANSPV